MQTKGWRRQRQRRSTRGTDGSTGRTWAFSWAPIRRRGRHGSGNLQKVLGDEYLGLFPLAAGRAGEAARAVLAGVLAWWGLGLFLVDALLQLLFLFLVLTARGVMILRRDVLHGCRGSRSGARFLRLYLCLVTHGCSPRLCRQGG